MDIIEITKITNNIKKGKVSPAEMKSIRQGLQLLKVAKEALIDGDEVHAKDVQEIGKQVGARLKSARSNKNYGQDELAKLSKISQSSISKIESGSKMISVNEAKALAKILGVTPQFLIAGE